MPRLDQFLELAFQRLVEDLRIVELVIGIILLGAASRSRFPKVLYVFGALAIVGGFATLFLSVEQARAIADWASSRAAIVVRLFGLLALALGSFIAYATSNKPFEYKA